MKAGNILLGAALLLTGAGFYMITRKPAETKTPPSDPAQDLSEKKITETVKNEAALPAPEKPGNVNLPKPVDVTPPVTKTPIVQASYSPGTLVRAGNESEVYEIDSHGVRHHATGPYFEHKGYSMASVKTITPEQMRIIPLGPAYTYTPPPPKYAPGTLLRAGKEAEVYEIDSNGIRHHVTGEYFAQKKYSMSNVRTITPDEMRKIPLGPPYTSMAVQTPMPVQHQSKTPVETPVVVKTPVKTLAVSTAPTAPAFMDALDMAPRRPEVLMMY